uniref:G_PROTEIN_RECEP_F1_2 domain-containing protein n=1 Tax=Caenorhabditis tropicalis TaxID=1561998 RepID=A0A1I7TY85_9PELO
MPTETESYRSNNTRALVITMAVSLFLCETVYGTVFILDYFVFVDTREQSILEDVDFIAVIFQIINSITHCFVCLLMSSQYRDTVKRLIFWGKEKETKITVPESSAHPTTVQTTKTSNSSRNTF